MTRAPLPVRLALRQLRGEPTASVLAAVFLALPTTALLVVNIVAGAADDSSLTPAGMTAAAATIAIPLALAITAMVAANLLVTARRNERMLALLGSVGAPPSVLFRVVAANGVATGVGAALVTLIVGIPAGWLWVGRVTPVDPVAVAGLALLAIVLGWAASIIPAIVAGNTDALRVLRSVPSPTSGRWRTDRIGLVLACIGAGMMLFGGIGIFALRTLYSGQIQPAFIVGVIGGFGGSALLQLGSIVVVIGIALALPAVFRMLGRLLARFGLAARLAARDAERGWARSVSASITVLVTTFAIGSYLALGVASAAQSSEHYIWVAQEGQFVVPLVDTGYSNSTYNPHPIDNIDAVENAVRTVLDPSELRVIQGVQGPFYGYPIDDSEGYSGREEMVFPLGGLPMVEQAENGICATQQLPTWRCTTYPYYDSRGFPLNPTTPTIWVGNVDDLRLILGDVDDATADALIRGEAIVFDAAYLSADNTVTTSWYDERFVPENQPDEFLPAGPPLRSVTTPGHLAPLDHRLDYGIFLSDAAAAELGLTAQPSQLLGTLATPLTTTEQRAAYDAVTDAVGSPAGFDAVSGMQFENGPGEIDPAWTIGALLLAGGIPLAASLVAVGLARAEGRDTDRTLAALGAAPGIRRRISAWYTAIVVGVAGVAGTVLATATALLMTINGTSALTRLPLLELGLLAFAVPALATLIVWLSSGAIDSRVLTPRARTSPPRRPRQR